MKYYHFTNWEPANIENVLQGKWPQAMQEYDSGNKTPLLDLFHNTSDLELLRNGYFRIGGWQFSIKEYCKTFWVKTRYYGIIQVFAPDKTTIRNALGSYHTIKIVEV